MLYKRKGFCLMYEEVPVPAERAKAGFEHSDTGVAGACMHSIFVSCFEMIMFI